MYHISQLTDLQTFAGCRRKVPPLYAASGMWQCGAMNRRKGEWTSKRIDREYPHQVEIAIPKGGLGDRIQAMDEFCRRHGLPFKTRALRGPPEAARWCFATPAAADVFHAEFGGERVNATK